MSVQFASLPLRHSLPKSELTTEVNGCGFDWVRLASSAAAASVALSEAWEELASLPAGRARPPFGASCERVAAD